MADFGPAVGAILEALAPALGPLLRVAARALLSSMLGLAFLDFATIFGAYHLGSRNGSTARGLIAVAIAAFLGLCAVPAVALKNAIGRAVVHAISTMGLGRRLLGLLFDGIVGMETEGEAGTRGSLAQRGVERLPLAEIERRLGILVARATGAGEGFLARRVRSALLGKLGEVTLQGLRAEGEQGGGVDLVRARAHLEAMVDRGLAARIERALLMSTALVALLCFGGGLAIAWLIGNG